MNKLFFYLATIFISISGQAQKLPPNAIGSSYENRQSISPPADIQLFDLREIAQRKIDTAYIIYHPAAWEPGFPNACSYSDTLELYCFDPKGRITRYTHFQLLGEYSTTMRYDSLGNILFREEYRRKGKDSGTKVYPTPKEDTTQYKKIVKKVKTGRDSVFTEIHFWQFKNGMDTAYIITTTKDMNGRAVEVSSRINKKYAREIDDHTGQLSYHYKSRYDNEGREVYHLIYDYLDLNKPSTEQTITFYDFGQVVETRNAVTNKLIGKTVQLLSVSNGIVTVSSDSRQITLIPLEKGSKLFKLKTISYSGEFPYIEYYEINYR